MLVERAHVLLVAAFVAALFGEGDAECAHTYRGILSGKARLLGPYTIKAGVTHTNVKIPFIFGCRQVALYVVSCTPTGRINTYFVDYNTVHIHRQVATKNGAAYALVQCKPWYPFANDGPISPYDQNASTCDEDETTHDENHSPNEKESPNENKLPKITEISPNGQEQWPDSKENTPNNVENPPNDKEKSANDQDESLNDQNKSPCDQDNCLNYKEEKSPHDDAEKSPNNKDEKSPDDNDEKSPNDHNERPNNQEKSPNDKEEKSPNDKEDKSPYYYYQKSPIRWKTIPNVVARLIDWEPELKPIVEPFE